MRAIRLAISLACFGLSGCFFADDGQGSPRADYTGALIVDWTIDGSTDADECDQGDAARLRLSIFTTSGRHVGDFTDPCQRFSTSVELAPGDYYADAVLEDPEGNARTTPVSIDDFSIVGRDSLSVPIDFPASSFY